MLIILPTGFSYGFQTFIAVLQLIPHEFLTPDFINDRKTIFPILERSDVKEMRPSGIAELQSRLDYVENTLLAKSPYIGGDKLSVADIHIVWAIRWALKGLGAEKDKEFSKDAFPKVWKWIESLPEATPEEISSEDAIKAIKGADYSAGDVSIMKDEPLGIEGGTSVIIESVE